MVSDIVDLHAVIGIAIGFCLGVLYNAWVMSRRDP
jgi:hypothetical protein